MAELIRTLLGRTRSLSTSVSKIHTAQTKSAGITGAAQALVDEYFREFRSQVSEDAIPAVTEADALMHELLECSHRYTTTSRYRSLLKRIAAALVTLEKAALLPALSKHSTPREATDLAILGTLSRLVPSAALSYEQALKDLEASTRLSWRGPATDLREALRETLDHLAPDTQVMAQPWYKQDKDTSGPTMKQKVRYVLSARGISRPSSHGAEQAASAVDELVGSFIRSVYTRSNVSTHTPTEKSEVLRVRDWVRVALCELLEVRA